ncbi:hypothetical protein EPN15_02510 [Patescibacteria group bacterium]|nr:MAG: hypothetical protein EPN15_02510 [Patescibacteria group bacterium]
MIPWLKNNKIYLFFLGILIFELIHFFFSGLILTPDSFTYLRLAEEIQKGRFYIEQWGSGSVSVPPLYPFFIFLLQKFTLDYIAAGILISIISSFGVILIVHKLTREIFGGKASLFAPTILVLNPFFSAFSRAILTESLFSLFFILNIYLLYKLSKNDSKYIFFFFLLIGASSALAWLTRDVGMASFALSVIWILYFLNAKKFSPIKIIMYFGAFLLGFIVFFAPFFVISKIGPSLSSYNNTAKKNILNTLTSPLLKDEMVREIAIRSLTDNGADYLIKDRSIKQMSLAEFAKQIPWILKKMALSVGRMSLYVLIITFGILGLFAMISTCLNLRNKNRTTVFLGTFMLIYLSFYAFAGSFLGALGPERYLVPLLPIIILFSSNGIVQTSEFIEDKIKTRSKQIFLFFIFCVIIMQTIQVRYGVGALHDVMGYRNLSQLIEFAPIKKNTIMARRPYLAYFSKSDFILTPYAEYEKIIRFARYKKVDYIFIEKDLLLPSFDFYKIQLESPNELIIIAESSRGVLYRLID